jgi:uncharacterized protein (DUF302 family)
MTPCPKPLRLDENDALPAGPFATARGPDPPTRSRAFVLAVVVFFWGVHAMAADGSTTVQSNFGPKETMTRLESAVKAKGLTVFARIDHAAGAAEAGMSLRPTELLICGNAKGGTPLMQATQTIGIDLPLKALVWQDASGNTWLSYNDPSWLAKRHGLGPEVEATVNGMAQAPTNIRRNLCLTTSSSASATMQRVKRSSSGHSNRSA